MDMHTQQEKASILLIYTGGTIGMIENPETGVLESFNFQHLKDNMPELKKLGYSVEADFIFSSICEELGVIFGMCLILICVSSFFEMIRIAVRIHDRFYQLVVYGIGIEFYAREPE